MNERRRLIFWTAGTNLLLLASALWSWDYYTESRRRLAAAASDTQLCRDYAADLLHVRTFLPDGASRLLSTDRQALSQRLYRIVQTCGMSPDSVIQSLRADSPRSIPGASGQVNTIEWSLNGLTLEQLARLLHQLETDEPQLMLTGLTLSNPRGVGTSSVWNVEPLVLTDPVDPSQEPITETLGVR